MFHKKSKRFLIKTTSIIFVFFVVYSLAKIKFNLENTKKPLFEVQEFYNKITKQIPQEKPIVIIIPSYNNQKWVNLNLNSAFNQNYSNYRIIYINDNSSDNTEQEILNFLKSNSKEVNFTYIKRNVRGGATCNRYNAALMCKNNEIIAFLDGDDWLADENVLQKINNLYSNKNVWSTYGKFKLYSSNKTQVLPKIPKHVKEKNVFREYSWSASHLKTCYAWLFKQIKIKDLFLNNNFFQVTGDLAEWFPILEMAGTHTKQCKEILYIYNDKNSLNDCQRKFSQQKEVEKIIRSKKKYKPLSNKPQKKYNILIVTHTNINQVKNTKKYNFEISDNLVNSQKYDYIIFLNKKVNSKKIFKKIKLLKLLKADAITLEKENHYLAVIVNPLNNKKNIKIFKSKNLNQNLIIKTKALNKKTKNLICLQ